MSSFESAPPGSVLVVAAHPDDEAIGVGGHLALLSRVWVVHITDGAPRNPSFASAAGFSSPHEYASARRLEARTALGAAGIPGHRITSLGFEDQETSYHLADLAQELCRIFRELGPAAVLAHSYEGGHPDHDATAFAVRAAAVLFERQGTASPAIIEFTSYHNSNEGFAVSDFIHRDGWPVVTVRLSLAQCELKRRIFEAYHSQEAVLQGFPIAIERFRQAPPYRFTEPPHPGRLFYETFDSGMDSERWRRLAAQGLEQLELDGG